MPPAENQKQFPLTPGAKVILETIRKDLFPQIENLKDIVVQIQACRVSYQLYSGLLSKVEKRYAEVAKVFFEVVKKLETPDILFHGVDGGDRNIVDYMQWQAAFKQNITEGVGYVEIIDRTLDRKLGAIQNNRTFLISLAAILISIIFAK